MQALVFVGAAACVVVDRGDRMRVVGGELRVDQLGASLEHLLRAGQVGDVGIRLAREHRVAGQAELLGALDLGIPVGTLDQAHAPAPTGLARGLGQPVDHERRALLVGLHGQAEAVPAVQRRVGEDLAEHVEREFEPVRFLGIDGHADALGLGHLRELEHARGQLGMHAGTIGHVVARMDRRQLDRDRRRVEDVLPRPALAERKNRVAVGLHVALGVVRGQGGFAEHVVGVAVGRVLLLRRAVLRLLDRAPHDELVTHDAHGLAHGQADHRLAGASDQPAQRADEIAARFLGQLDQAAGQHQAPGRGIDEQRFAGADVLLPVGFAELVADQLVGGFRVGHAQQRLGDAHQQHAFLAREVVFAHERFDRRLVVGFRAHARDQLRGPGQHRFALRRRHAGLVEQFVDRLGFVARPGGGDAGTRRIGLRRQFGGKDFAHGAWALGWWGRGDDERRCRLHGARGGRFDVIVAPWLADRVLDRLVVRCIVAGLPAPPWQGVRTPRGVRRTVPAGSRGPLV